MHYYSRKHSLAFLWAGIALLCACSGPVRQFEKARGLEKEGYYVEAGVKYEQVYRRHPDFSGSPEALYRLARIYQKKLQLYSHAHRFYGELVERYPQAEPWTSRAKLGLFNSPDFFPLADGSFWIEGDSATGGRNMRAEWVCREVSTGTYHIQRRISAGSSLVTKINRYYTKGSLELRERLEPGSSRHTVVLSYPFVQGRTWKSVRDGRAVLYTVIAESVPVKVKAGEFSNCLKISEEYPDIAKSRKYNYYAPGVGWVLTTIASSGGKEHANTELLSYKIVPEPEE